MIDTLEIVIPRYLTAEQCATRFAISLRHFKYLVAAGEMPQPIKFGKCSRWSIATLEEYESEKMQEHQRPHPAVLRKSTKKRK